MRKAKKFISPVAKLLAITAITSAVMVSTPAAAYSYNVYESRSVVVKKSRLINGASSVCKRAVGRIPAWGVIAPLACNKGTAGRIYQSAAYSGCKMKTRITINTNSQFSWDKTSSVKHTPYSCRR